QVERLAYGDVERADTFPDGCLERTFDRDDEIAQCVQRLLGQPVARDAMRLGPRVHLHPANGAALPVCFTDCRIDDTDHCGRHIDPDAVAFYERNDRPVGDVERTVRMNADLGAVRRDSDVLVAHDYTRARRVLRARSAMSSASSSACS